MTHDEIKEIGIARLRPSQSNPRKAFRDVDQFELMDSIRSVGVLSYLLVRPVGEDFEIVAGERRYRAAKALGLESLPCRVRSLTDEAVGKIQLIENIQRANLSPVEELAGVRELEELGIHGAELAKSLGKTNDWLQLRLDLGKLPSGAQEAVGAGRVSLASVPDLLYVSAGECEKFVQEVLEIEEPVPVLTLRAMIEERYRAPREAKIKWSTFVEDYKSKASGKVEGLSDPESWAQYVRPYGEGVGRWKLATEKIGGLAARQEEARLTWGDLAKVHGVPVFLVPVGGVRSGEITAVELVERSLIESAEKAAKAAGQDVTLGARRTKAVEPKMDPIDRILSDLTEKGGGLPSVVSFDPVTRSRPWNPWAVAENVFLEEEHSHRVELCREVLGEFAHGWKEKVVTRCQEPIEELDESALVVWYLLDDFKPEDLRGRRLAALLGVSEFWIERVAA
jgi:ParB family chromosome partitioning protein